MRSKRREFFLATHSCDFSTALHAVHIVIFLLTSFRVDSIHQLVATKHRCLNSMKNGKGE
jgi:hypothetical protein